MSILVVGGAGYIGSHTVHELVEHGESVVVVDNLSLGHRSSVEMLGVPFYCLDMGDIEGISGVIRKHKIDTVIHFAAYSLVAQSMAEPLKYYENNVSQSTRLLEAMVQNGVSRIVFSSTASVYGDPVRTPILESDPLRPQSPYGETKLAIERMLMWAYQAHGLRSISLRYFNAAGAHPSGLIGEHHAVETHLIPLVLQVALGKRSIVSVFGDDYPTEDGTCVRDYVHVMDLASAHRLAVQRLRTDEVTSESYNLGSGTGYSVSDIITAAREITGHAIPANTYARRPGDPAILIADSSLARRVLQWAPRCEEIHRVIETAWKWHQSHPLGYDCPGTETPAL